MAIPANRKSNSEKPQLGNVNGLCIGVYAFQEVFKGDVQNKVLYLFEIKETYKKGDRTGKRMLVSTRFNNYISPANAKKPSMLRKMLLGWFGSIPEGEFDLEEAVGRPALLNLVTSDDGQYVNVGSIGPLPEGMAPLNRETDVGYFPDWIKDKISGKTRPASEWTLEDETPVPEPENPMAGQEDPLEAKRADLRARATKIWQSGVFNAFELDQMQKKLNALKGALPSQEYLISEWESDVKKALVGPQV